MRSPGRRETLDIDVEISTEVDCKLVPRAEGLLTQQAGAALPRTVDGTGGTPAAVVENTGLRCVYSRCGHGSGIGDGRHRESPVFSSHGCNQEFKFTHVTVTVFTCGVSRPRLSRVS